MVTPVVFVHEHQDRRGPERVVFLDSLGLVSREDLGAGEIFLTAVDRDGTQKGYDVTLLRQVTEAVSVPVIASGGAGQLSDFKAAVRDGGASAVAAGSMFVFHGKHRAVLITYPDYRDLQQVFA